MVIILTLSLRCLNFNVNLFIIISQNKFNTIVYIIILINFNKDFIIHFKKGY